ncbi:MAG: DUF1549 domain-containing protein, partial [Rubripirellula sp.]
MFGNESKGLCLLARFCVTVCGDARGLVAICVAVSQLSTVGTVFSVSAAEPFEKAVAPIFERRCLNCHNDKQKAGDFSLETAESAFATDFMEPGNSDRSHLIDLIETLDDETRMPKDSPPLSDAEIRSISNWIDSGADWPTSLRLQATRVTDTDWWSFKPVTRPKVPRIQDDWIRTPIDAFVLRTLQRHELQHSQDADRRSLIRRLSHDLLGLPPTPAQVDAFVSDQREDAYESLVDRLLESPHYGERWARHWLDVVKYADTCGYDKDKLRPNAWPYRDYVIR